MHRRRPLLRPGPWAPHPARKTAGPGDALVVNPIARREQAGTRKQLSHLPPHDPARPPGLGPPASSPHLQRRACFRPGGKRWGVGGHQPYSRGRGCMICRLRGAGRGEARVAEEADVEQRLGGATLPRDEPCKYGLGDPAAPSTETDVQPFEGASMFAQTTATRPTPESPAPVQSTRRATGSRDSGMSLSAPTSASAANGTLTMKIDPHQKWSSKKPPRTGPRATPMPRRSPTPRARRPACAGVRSDRRAHPRAAATPRKPACTRRSPTGGRSRSRSARARASAAPR